MKSILINIDVMNIDDIILLMFIYVSLDYGLVAVNSAVRGGQLPSKGCLMGRGTQQISIAIFIYV